jgi:hypothetical protein
MPAGAAEPATLPHRAAARSSVRPWACTCSTRCLIDVCALVSGTSAIPAATGLKMLRIARSRTRTNGLR